MVESNSERIKRMKDDWDYAVKHGQTSCFEYGGMEWLIEQTERAQELSSWQETARNYFGENVSLKEENKRLREALDFYANAETYKTNVVNQWEPIIPVNRDSGELARQTLKGVVRNGETWS